MKNTSPKHVTPQSVTPKKAEPAISAPEIRVLKIGTCPSLSGKSTLTYHIGCTPESDIQVRVFGNTGGGLFSQEWIALSGIGQTFSKVPDGIPITAHLLSPLYLGKSANSHAFLFAALKSEGLVRLMKDKKGCYECTDASEFMAGVKALIDSAVDLKVEAQAVKVGPLEVRVMEVETVPPKPPTSGKKTGKPKLAPQASNE